MTEQSKPVVYESLLRMKGVADGSETLLEVAQRLRDLASELVEMHQDGVVIVASEDDYIMMQAEDPAVAKKHNFCERELEEDEIDDGEAESA